MLFNHIFLYQENAINYIYIQNFVFLTYYYFIHAYLTCLGPQILRDNTL